MHITYLKFAYHTLLLLVCLVNSHTAFAAKPVVPPFQAEYRLSHNGLEIGLVKLVMKQIAPLQYQLSSTTKTSGLLSFLRNDDVVEESIFQVTADQLIPSHYRYLEKLGGGEKSITLAFNWQQGQVLNTSNGNSWQMEVHPGVVDKALMQIALMRDLQQLKKELSYQVADGGRLKNYRFSPQGEETINLNGQRYSAIKLVRKKDNKSQITTYWCAKSLHMLPILLTRKKKYGLFKMELLSASFDN